MKKLFLTMMLLLTVVWQAMAVELRRPIDNEHPLWLVHVDVWYAADPQKIIDLIPDDIKPYVCMNLSLSCSYDAEKNIYKMPRVAFRTYKSWASVCQQNGMWFTCQPASGGKTHIQDDDLVTLEYFFKNYPNFLGWNYAEQFWGFDEPDKASATQVSRLALFAKLVEMSHQYGGFLTISFCGNFWSHGLNPVGMMKRNSDLLEACRKYPENIQWLYKYTTSSCFYNNESVTISPFISGLATNYGVRYDNCGWNEAMEILVGKDKCKYPASAGIGAVMEQTGINGGAVWDGPELTWREECFHEVNNTTVDGYKRRNWEQFPNFKSVWSDLFRKVIDGTLRIPTRQEVVDRTKIAIIADMNSGSDEDKYASWGSLYDGLYKQDDPTNPSYVKGEGYEGYNGQLMANLCYLKKTGRYATIPICLEMADATAQAIPTQVLKSTHQTRWATEASKVNEFNEKYPEVSKGDLFVARMGNQLVTYTPYTYLNKKKAAEGRIPLAYNTCDSLILNYGKLSSGLVREYGDHIDFYLNNFRTDTTTVIQDVITIKGATTEPTFTYHNHDGANVSITPSWNASTHLYSLYVNHMGAVDITIQCAGSNSRPTAPAAQPLSAPKQPAVSNLPIIIEAEDMDTRSVQDVSITNYGWYAPDMYEFSGNGFVTMGTSTNGSLRHQLKLNQAGEYTITMRYCNTASAGTMQASINGTTKTFSVEKTDKNDWKKTTFTANLIAGTNDLRLNNVSGINMIVDQIVYTPAGTEPDKFTVLVREADFGSVTADVSEALEGQTITLTVHPNEGCVLKELRVVNSVYYTMDKTIAIGSNPNEITFVMPDDNVVIQPVFEDLSVPYVLDFTDVNAGTIPPGWRCLQENNVVHQYPETYGSGGGSRVFSGFTGYQGKALYWREKNAEYGRQTDFPLTLQPGKYKLTFAIAAWKESPQYKASILTSTSSTIASTQALTATPNAAGNDHADLTSSPLQELDFTIQQAGNYVISFTNANDTGGLQEFLLLDCGVKMLNTGISTMTTLPSGEVRYYDLQGRRLEAPVKGQVIILRSADGRSRKILF